jgi:hypothetical protein
MLKLLDRQIAIAGIIVYPAERDVDHRQLIAECGRLLAVYEGIIDPLPVVLLLVFQPVSFAQFGIAESKLRIVLDSRLKLGNGQVEVPALVIPLKIAQSFQIAFIGSRDRGVSARLCIGPDIQDAGEPPDRLLLESADVSCGIVNLNGTNLS